MKAANKENPAIIFLVEDDWADQELTRRGLEGAISKMSRTRPYLADAKILDIGPGTTYGTSQSLENENGPEPNFDSGLRIFNSEIRNPRSAI